MKRQTYFVVVLLLFLTQLAGAQTRVGITCGLTMMSYSQELYVGTIEKTKFSDKFCTIFMASRGGTVLVGNNEDYNDPETTVWFFPPEPGKYGRIYFGYEHINVQGGMNEHGLFFDGCTAPHLEVTQSTHLPSPDRHILAMVMEECKSVSEALALFGRYNLRTLENGQWMLVDKTGASAIVEGDSIIHKEGDYQVCSNFYHSHPELGGWPCDRYNTAREMLSQSGDISVDFFRFILDEVHIDLKTQYSNIYDPNQGVIYLYHYHNYDEFIKIDLKEELMRGVRTLSIPELFAKMRPVSPEEGATLSYNAVTLKWEGENTQYQLFCSTSSDFEDCAPISVSFSKSNPYIVGGIGSFFLGLFFLVSIRHLRWKRVTLFSALVVLGLFLSCSKDDSNYNENQFTYTLDNLQPNTKYYWKVQTQCDLGFTSETIVRSFWTID